MSLLSIITGAKPRIGTPPFAPPHPNTGGAELPTTPETLPVKRGLAGAIDRFFNPTNALGQFGQALVASGNNPLGQAMGHMIQQRGSREAEARKLTLAQQERENQFTDWQRKQQWEMANKGPDLTGFQKDLAAAGIDPNSEKGQKLYKQYVTNRVDPVMQLPTTVNGVPGYQIGPRSQFLGGDDGSPASSVSPDVPDPAPANLPPAGGVRSGSLAPTKASALMPRLIQQESGGRVGIRGPQTKYGQPLGMTQMLPATAREMASKIGLPWHPGLLTDTSPAGAEYQTRLGQAYLEEGLQRFGGDERKALMYYHGGPNERLWGPKTRAYANSILGQSANQSPRRIVAKADYDALPSGTPFIAPDGSRRVKP